MAINWESVGKDLAAELRRHIKESGLAITADLRAYTARVAESAMWVAQCKAEGLTARHRAAQRHLRAQCQSIVTIAGIREARRIRETALSVAKTGIRIAVSVALSAM